MSLSWLRDQFQLIIVGRDYRVPLTTEGVALYELGTRGVSCAIWRLTD